MALTGVMLYGAGLVLMPSLVAQVTSVVVTLAAKVVVGATMKAAEAVHNAVWPGASGGRAAGTQASPTRGNPKTFTDQFGVASP
jgi:hypothetical protein